MNDFANDDYVTKNIRVMPMSGGTLENQSEHTSKHHHASPLRGDDSDVEDSKIKSEIALELLDARQIVKERKVEEERKQKEIADKLAKKNRKWTCISNKRQYLCWTINHYTTAQYIKLYNK